ncbi:hypothetical protein CR513_41830, partial [Mucuna pruriens]
MCEQGYKKTIYGHCVFFRKFSDDDFVILLLYVDDMFIVGKSISRIDRIIRDRQAKKLWLSQEHCVKRVLQRFHMENAKAVSTPLAAHFKLSSGHSPSNEAEKTNMSRVPYASVVGSLMYAMVCTRLDIAHVVGVVSDKPTLVGYSDLDMVGDIDSKKSTSGYLIKSMQGVTLGEEILVRAWFCSEQSAIHLGKNSTFHSRSKHINV